MSDDTAAQKAAKWDRIRGAWNTYELGGALAFDWDYDSRDLMRALEGGVTDTFGTEGGGDGYRFDANTGMWLPLDPAAD